MMPELIWSKLFFGLLPWGLPLVGGMGVLLVGPFFKKHHPFSFGVSLAVAVTALWGAFHHWFG